MIMNAIVPGLRSPSKRSSAGSLSSALAASAATAAGYKEYCFANINPRLGIFPDAPLTAIGTLRVEF